MARVSWPPVIERAAEIVQASELPMTLRQLFYRLVSEGLIENKNTHYKRLSRLTAEARRQNGFPDLVDGTREIWLPTAFSGTDDALDWLADIYRRDRTEGQEWAVYIGAEKDTMRNALRSWFDDLGAPVVLLRGYSSQTYVDEVAEHVGDQGRPAVLIYGGDLDPSGEDIARDFVERTGCFDAVERIAVLPGQVDEYGLIPQPGKRTDSRSAAFREKHGRLIQVEVEALEPVDLRALYQDAIDRYVDVSTLEGVIEQEKLERTELQSD